MKRYSVDEITRAARKAVKVHACIKAIYLFGSYTEELAKVPQDIDLAFLCDSGQNKLFYENLRLDLFRILSLELKTDKVDIVVLNSVKSSELKFAVVQDGLLLYEEASLESSGELIEYELRVKHEYWDHLAALKRCGLTNIEA